MGAFKNLIGQRFGRLVVVKRVENSPSGGARWLCKCDCGNEVITSTSSLNSCAKSCGCLKKDLAKDRWTGNSNPSYKHGGRHTRLYSIWDGMKARCYYEGHTWYSNYGGRGITICEEWRNDFETFRDWALANGYNDDLSIDRIDANGPYCPENCRWVKWKEQCINRRKREIPSKRVPIMCMETGETFESVSAAVKKTGISQPCISKCIGGKQPKAGGYTWKKINE